MAKFSVIVNYNTSSVKPFEDRRSPSARTRERIMQTRVAQYLNEIVSLTMMALLIVALAAGESGKAGVSPGAVPQTLAASRDSSVRHEGE